VAVQAPWTPVRLHRERSLVVHLVPVESRRQIETVALVGPEGIDARFEQWNMILPVRLDVALVDGLVFARRHVAMQARQFFSRRRNDVHDYLYIALVQVADDLGRFPGEHLGVERERWLLGVPTPGCMAGA